MTEKTYIQIQRMMMSDQPKQSGDVDFMVDHIRLHQPTLFDGIKNLYEERYDINYKYIKHKHVLEDRCLHEPLGCIPNLPEELEELYKKNIYNYILNGRMLTPELLYPCRYGELLLFAFSHNGNLQLSAICASSHKINDGERKRGYDTLIVGNGTILRFDEDSGKRLFDIDDINETCFILDMPTAVAYCKKWNDIMEREDKI